MCKFVTKTNKKTTEIYVKPERLFRNKHSNFVRTFVKYGRKRFVALSFRSTGLIILKSRVLKSCN